MDTTITPKYAEYKRLPGWQLRFTMYLNDFIRFPYSKKLDWHTTSCLSFVAGGIDSILGIDPHKEDGWDDKYNSEYTAAKAIIDHGLRSVEDIARSWFPEIPLLESQRGDLILFPARQDATPHNVPHNNESGADNSLVEIGTQIDDIMFCGLVLGDPPLVHGLNETGYGRGYLKDGLKAFAVGKR